MNKRRIISPKIIRKILMIGSKRICHRKNPPTLTEDRKKISDFLSIGELCNLIFARYILVSMRDRFEISEAIAPPVMPYISVNGTINIPPIIKEISVQSTT